MDSLGDYLGASSFRRTRASFFPERHLVLDYFTLSLPRLAQPFPMDDHLKGGGHGMKNKRCHSGKRFKKDAVNLAIGKGDPRKNVAVDFFYMHSEIPPAGVEGCPDVQAKGNLCPSNNYLHRRTGVRVWYFKCLNEATCRCLFHIVSFRK